MSFIGLLPLARNYIEEFSADDLRHVRDVLIRRVCAVGFPSTWVSYLRPCPSCDRTMVDIGSSHGGARNDIGRELGLECIGCGYCATHCCSCVQCNDCGRYISEDDICGDCTCCARHCSCSRCERCGERVDTDSGDFYCSECHRCESCDNCEREADGIRFDDRSHDDPEGECARLKFWEPDRTQLKRNPSPRFLSPEIEVAKICRSGRRITQVVYDEWKGSIVHDGSLGTEGFEINPAPAGGDLFLKQMDAIFDALSGADAEVNDDCGMHVHVDARDFSSFDIRRLVRFYNIIEPVLFAMVPGARRTNTYCTPCASKFMRWIGKPVKSSREIRYNVIKAVYGNNFRGTIAIEPLTKQVNKITKERCTILGKDGGPKMSKRPVTKGDRSFRNVKNSKDSAPRYNALNLVSWFYRGTIECRLYPGTVDVSDASNWCMMWACIMDYVYKSSDADISNLHPDLRLVAMNKALEGRDQLKQFVVDSIVRWGSGKKLVELDTIPPPLPDPPAPPPLRSPVEMLFDEISQGTAVLSQEERDLDSSRSDCCDGCRQVYANEVFELRQRRLAQQQLEQQHARQLNDVELDARFEEALRFSEPHVVSEPVVDSEHLIRF